MGIIYLVSSILLGVGFAYYCVRCAFDESRTDVWPKKTFLYSILYLALFFGAMSVDSVFTKHFSHYTYLTSLEREAKRLRAQQTIETIRKQHNGEDTTVVKTTLD